MLSTDAAHSRNRVLISAVICIGALAAPLNPAAAQPTMTCGADEFEVVIGGVRTCVAYAGGLVPGNGQPQELQVRSARGGSTVTQCVRRIGDDDVLGPAGPRTVPCYIESKGWYSHSWDCHLRLAGQNFVVDPNKPPHGYDPNDPPGGTVYLASCYPPVGNEFPDGPHWLAEGLWAAASPIILTTEPDGFGGEPSRLGELWVEAVNALQLRGPEIATAPPLSSGGLVGLRTWLWTEQDNPQVWGELSATADARPQGLNEWVDVQAEPVEIVWDMGEPGREPVRCDHPGEAHQPNLHSHWPDCGHTYHRPSRTQPDGTYPITAITTWRIQWWVNGTWDGEAELQVGSQTTYRVNEIQVLVGGH